MSFKKQASIQIFFLKPSETSHAIHSNTLEKNETSKRPVSPIDVNSTKKINQDFANP